MKTPTPFIQSLVLGLLCCGPLPLFAQALTLQQIEQGLLARNRDILAARRAVQGSAASTVVAGARPNPTLSFGVSSINPSTGIGNGSLRDKTVDSSVRMDQVLERGDRRNMRIALAQSLEGASAEDLAEVTRQQLLAARFAFYDLLWLQEKLEITRYSAALFQIGRAHV